MNDILLLLLLIDSNIKKKFWCNINMSNLQQNEIENVMQNEIEQVRRKINLWKDKLKKNEKSQNQFQNGLKQVKNNTDKKKEEVNYGRIFLKPKNYKI